MKTFHFSIFSSLVISSALPIQANEFRQTFGGYADTEGVEHRSVNFNASFTTAKLSSNMTDSRLAINVGQDDYLYRKQTPEAKGVMEAYGDYHRINQTAGFNASQTWNKITDTRFMATVSEDSMVVAKSFAAGVSHWVWHENLRLSADVSRTEVNQPQGLTLDYDSTPLESLARVNSTGINMAVRHLASPTTMVDYTYGYITREDRPDTRSYGFGIREFLTATRTALHGSATRVFNRGRLSTATTYGQVDASIAEAALYQHIWDGGRAKTSYRYYREDETTRAYKDEKVLGTDTITVGLEQDLRYEKKKYTLSAVGGRYLTNDNRSARSFEAGVSAKF